MYKDYTEVIRAMQVNEPIRKRMGGAIRGFSQACAEDQDRMKIIEKYRCRYLSSMANTICHRCNLDIMLMHCDVLASILIA